MTERQPAYGKRYYNDVALRLVKKLYGVEYLHPAPLAPSPPAPMTNHRIRLPLLVLGTAVLFAPGRLWAQDAVGPRPDYAPVARMLEAFIRHEMADQQIPAMSIALVDGSEIVWSRGFGLARPQDSLPATAETVYRVGAIGELFTDFAVMQEVEAGRLRLDEPVTTYLPDFHPQDRFGQPITLRMLLSHQSGLGRQQIGRAHV